MVGASSTIVSSKQAVCERKRKNKENEASPLYAILGIFPWRVAHSTP